MGAMFDGDTAVLLAAGLARDTFESFAGHRLTDPPLSHPVDAMQVALMRWQRDRFGLQVETHDLRMALGVIEEMGETFDANKPNDAEMAIDGLGDVMVFASQLATANRLAIAPILDLARLFTHRSDIVPLRAAAVLAQVVLKGSQKIRGMDDRVLFQLRLTGALAMCIAKSLDDVELIHDVAVKAAEVFVIIGNEVMNRGKPGQSDAVPALPGHVMTQEERAAALEQRQDRAASKLIEAAHDPGFDVSDSDVTAPK